MSVVLLIEARLEVIFHPNSYGYRPNRSAHDAIGQARERCWRYNWILDMDISKFFDTIDNDLLMKAIERHVQEQWILLYIRRWLKMPYTTTTGECIERTMGVPQGSVIEPSLANLYLHYTFDKWMSIYHPTIPFEVLPNGNQYQYHPFFSSITRKNLYINKINHIFAIASVSREQTSFELATYLLFVRNF